MLSSLKRRGMRSLLFPSSLLCTPTLSAAADSAVSILPPNILRRPFPLLPASPFGGLKRGPPSPNAASSPSSSFRRFSSSASSMADQAVSYLAQREAAEVDEILMGPLGFSVDQLMVWVVFISSLVGFFSSSSPSECYLIVRNWPGWALLLR